MLTAHAFRLPLLPQADAWIRWSLLGAGTLGVFNLFSLLVSMYLCVSALSVCMHVCMRQPMPCHIFNVLMCKWAVTEENGCVLDRLVHAYIHTRIRTS